MSLHYREAAGSYPAERWREALDETGLFEPRVEAEVVHVHGTDPEGFVALVGSWSWISNLPDEERQAFLERVRELIGDQASCGCATARRSIGRGGADVSTDREIPPVCLGFPARWPGRLSHRRVQH